MMRGVSLASSAGLILGSDIRGGDVLGGGLDGGIVLVLLGVKRNGDICVRRNGVIRSREAARSSGVLFACSMIGDADTGGDASSSSGCISIAGFAIEGSGEVEGDPGTGV
jgi:hypothetical protein